MRADLHHITDAFEATRRTSRRIRHASFLARRLRAPKLLQEGFDMTIFGVALLALCTLVGVFVGDLLGIVLGVKANVGGVGWR
jgi:hypothetical protein